VVENAANGTLAGITAFASDADATNNAITYSLTDAAGGRFAIDSSTGVVSVAGVINRETAASHQITVRADSADGSFSDQNFTIAVYDVGEFNVTTISDANAAASDADATTNAITYSLTDDAGGRFAINASTGVVSVAGAIDRETAASHQITVRATSLDGSFNTQNFTIAVYDVDEFNLTPITDVNAANDAVNEKCRHRRLGGNHGLRQRRRCDHERRRLQPDRQRRRPLFDQLDDWRRDCRRRS
jgi:hypothetical protein